MSWTRKILGCGLALSFSLIGLTPTVASAKSPRTHKAVSTAVMSRVPKTVPEVSSTPLIRHRPTMPAGRYLPAASPAPVGSKATPAQQAAVANIKPVRELVERRTARSDVWADSAGGLEVHEYSTDRYYKPAGSSTYLPISTVLSAKAAEPGWWSSTANSWTSSFGPAGGGTQSVQLSGASGSVSFSPDGAATVAPSVVGSGATYHDLWPSTDAVYAVTPTGVNEDLVLASAGAPSTFNFDLGAGQTAAAASGGGLQISEGGKAVGTVPPLTVSTANGDVISPAASGATLTPIATAQSIAGGVGITVSQTWLASLPISDFPVTIDPSINLTAGEAVGSPFSVDQAGTVTNSVMQVGTDMNGNIWEAGMQFAYNNYLPTYQPGSPVYRVLSASLRFAGNGPGSVAASEPLSTFYTNSSQPPSYGTLYGPVAPPESDYPGGGEYAPIDVTSQVQENFTNLGTPSYFAFSGAASYSPTLKVLGTFDNVGWEGPVLSLDLLAPPPVTTLKSPADGAILATATPTLTAVQVTDPADSALCVQGDPSCSCPPGQTSCPCPVNDNCNYGGYNQVWYEFQISSSPSFVGAIADSGWQALWNTPSRQNWLWTVPAGSLVDGGTYYTRVFTETDSTQTPYLFDGGTTEFKVNLRLGDGGPSPTDTVGSSPSGTSTPSAGAPSPGTSPASETVNEVTGNLALSLGNHSVSALGGSVGATLSYNSLNSTQQGLLGQYYTIDANNQPVTQEGQRLDGNIDTNYDSQAPTGGLEALAGGGRVNYYARWSGSVTVPTPGNWAFGVVSSGDMSVYVGGSSQATVSSGGQQGASPTFGAAQSLNGPVSLSVVGAHNQLDQGVDQLWMENLSVTPPVPVIVPSNWLSPTAATLPPGWSLSANNLSGGYTAITDLGHSVVAHESSGGTATFTETGIGQYSPPAGNTDFLSVNGAGQFQISTAANQLYTFNPDGTVKDVTTVADDLHPTALSYTYHPNTTGGTQLQDITDPVSGRSVVLAYGGEADANCPATDATGNATNVPVGMLCAISYWDGTTTVFDYNTQGQLVQVTNPGLEVSGLGYNSNGQLSSILDPLGYDAVSSGHRSDCPAATPTSWGTCETQVSYNASGQVATVTQPAPTPRALQPQRSYTYSSASTTEAGTTTVSIAGFAPQSGYELQASHNANGEITSETNSTGLTSNFSWDPATGQVDATVSPTGLETTNVYNISGEVTDSYGPAPSACFLSTYLPVAKPSTTPGCGVSAVADTHNVYDGHITGLAETFWANSQLAGAATMHSTTTASTLSDTWATPPVGTTQWSVQLTGMINLPTAGNWTFGASTTTPSVTVSIANQPLVTNLDNGQLGKPSKTLNNAIFDVTTPGEYPISVQLVGNTSAVTTATVEYQAPGGTEVVIPSSALDPNYGLKTSTTDPDGKVITAAYSNSAGIGPEDGLATSVTKDPSGLALKTVTNYEKPSATTYFRRTATILPAGNQTTYSYYTGTGGPVAEACGVTASVPQGGQLEEQIDPSPGGTGQPRAQEFVYNVTGQQVGRRVGPSNTIASLAWQCTSYNQRAQMTQQTWPAAGSGPARTVTHSYALAGNPLTSSVTDASGTISSTVDLLGRPVSYTDATGTTTTYTFDQAGRLKTTSGPEATVTTAYDPNSSLATTTTVNGAVLATAGYDGFGRLATVAYANGTSATMGYDPKQGYEDSLLYSKTASGGLMDGDQITKSVGGRTVTELVDTGGSTLVNPNPAGATATDYTYDGVGRLVSANLPGEVATYGYANNVTGDHCTSPTEGQNTNRTSVTLTPTTGGATSSDYCYNTADQLVTSIVGKVTSAAYSYDGHGNQTNDNGTTYTWGASDRSMSATPLGGTVVSDTYDAVDRLLSRTTSAGTVGYIYGGFSDSPAGVVNASKQVVQGFVGLPGGVTVTVQNSGDTFSDINLQGDTTLTVDAAGKAIGSPVTYDPWGHLNAGQQQPVNAKGGSQLGGYTAAGKLTNSTTGTILLGARTYNPAEARFLSVDLINGGCANKYTYAWGDPLNQSDLTGQASQSCNEATIKNPLGILTVRISPNGKTLNWGLQVSEMVDTAFPNQVVSGTIAESGRTINVYTPHDGPGYQYHGVIWNLPGKVGKASAILTFTFVVSNADNLTQGAWGEFQCKLQ